MANHLFDGLLAGRETDSRILLRLPDGDDWSYAELVASSGQLANLLLERGVAPGDRVAVQVAKSVQAIALYLATVRAGYVSDDDYLQDLGGSLAVTSATLVIFGETIWDPVELLSRFRSGKQVTQVLDTLRERPGSVDPLFTQAVERVSRVMHEFDAHAIEEVFSEGLLNVMDEPEFERSARLRRVFNVLQDRVYLGELAQRLSDNVSNVLAGGADRDRLGCRHGFLAGFRLRHFLFI